jgi:hypothetical protein
MNTRIGFRDPKIIWQGAHPHGNQKVGRAPDEPHKDKRRTFALVGCVVTCVSMALRILGAKAGSLPLEIQKIGLEFGCWKAGVSSVEIQKLIRAQGLKSDLDTGIGKVIEAKKLKKIILGILANNGVALLHVDYDNFLADGDETGEHWVLAFAADLNLNRIFIADPATAKIEFLDLDTLENEISWSRIKRKYKAVRCISAFV